MLCWIPLWFFNWQPIKLGSCKFSSTLTWRLSVWWWIGFFFLLQEIILLLLLLSCHNVVLVKSIWFKHIGEAFYPNVTVIDVLPDINQQVWCRSAGERDWLLLMSFSLWRSHKGKLKKKKFCRSWQKKVNLNIWLEKKKNLIFCFSAWPQKRLFVVRRSHLNLFRDALWFKKEAVGEEGGGEWHIEESGGDRRR